MKLKLLDMILTSISNNSMLLENIIEDIDNRFHTKLDKNKLQHYIDTVEVEVKESINAY